jgi:hypothetical protein
MWAVSVVLSLALGFAAGWLVFHRAERGATPTVTTAAAPAAPDAPGSAPPKPGTVAREQRPPSGQSGAGFSFSYQAQRFSPPRVVAAAEPDQWDRSSPESSYRAVLYANRSGSQERILAQFAPDERATVQARMDEEALRRNKQYFDSVTEETIAEVVEYGQYRVLVVVSRFRDGDVAVRNVPMIQTPEGWLITNALVKDVFFNYLVEGINEAYRGK